MASSTGDSDPLLLPFDVIINTINEVSDGTLVVSTGDLKNIQSEKAIEIYKVFLFALYPLLPENLGLIPISDFVVDVKPSWLYEDSISLLGFTVALSRVFQSCDVNGFTFRDLVAPKPKRTHRLLSSLVNFLRFCSSKQSVIDDAYSHTSDLMKSFEDLKLRKSEGIRAIEELELKLAEERREQTVLKPEAEFQRTKYTEMEQQQNQVEKIEKEEEQSLSNKEVVLDILQTQDNTESATALIAERKILLDKLSCKERQHHDLDEDCTTGLQLMSSFATALDKRAEAARTMDKSKEANRKQEQNFMDLLASTQNVIRQQNMKVERLSRQQSIHQHRKAGKLDDLKTEHKEISVLKSEKDKKICLELSEIEAEEKAISEKISLLHCELEERIMKAGSVYERILDQLDAYHESVNTAFEKLSAINVES